jgi:hypothetical protein
MADSGSSPAAPLALDAGDTAWMLTASVLVLLMSLPGCVPRAAAPAAQRQRGRKQRAGRDACRGRPHRSLL